MSVYKNLCVRVECDCLHMWFTVLHMFVQAFRLKVEVFVLVCMLLSVFVLLYMYIYVFDSRLRVQYIMHLSVHVPFASPAIRMLSEAMSPCVCLCIDIHTHVYVHIQTFVPVSACTHV